MTDNSYELFPIVTDEGQFVGTTSRGHAHDGSKILHPVVHLHVLNSKGELYLQKRPEWKDIQPGKWDTACGGHIGLGERLEDALYREVGEELGISDFTARFICRYTFESNKEKELVNVYVCEYDGEITPSKSELDGGRFWSLDEIQQSIGQGLLTPNFENEFQSCLLPALAAGWH